MTNRNPVKSEHIYKGTCFFYKESSKTVILKDIRKQKNVCDRVTDWVADGQTRS